MEFPAPHVVGKAAGCAPEIHVDPTVQECHPVSATFNQHDRLQDWLICENMDSIVIRTLDSRAPLTYKDLHEQCELFSIPLKGRVALVFHREEAAELAVALIVLMNAGCAACPLDAKMSTSDMHKALKNLQCTFVVTTQRHNVDDIVPDASVKVVVVETSATQCGVLKWPVMDPDWLETGSPTDGDVLFLQTSGTTSQPKIVGLTLQQLQYNAHAIASSLHLTSSDVNLNVMPFFHIGGIACSLLAVLWAHSTVICTSFDPPSFLAALEGDLRPTWYYAAPTIHKALLLHLRASRRDRVRSNLRLIRSGAAHLPHEDATNLARIFGCTMLPTYSMTECMPVCSPQVDYALGKPNSVGYPIGPALRIAGSDGNALPYGTTGDVMICGPGVFKGYANDRADFVDGWFRTGDRGNMDTDGCVFLSGRSREMAKRGGEQISLHEVDEALLAHPDVDACISFAVPNEFWGEEVAAAVLLKNDVSPDAILAFARNSDLAEYKVPSQVIILTSMTQLPQTATGKVIRSQIPTALNVTAVDLKAIAAVTDACSPNTCKGNNNDIPRMCKAIYGVRFLFAFWVAQHHIGLMPFKAWARLQNTSLNMTGFTFIAGFSLASSVTSSLSAVEGRRFIANRIGALHALYLVSIVYALPFFFISKWSQIGETSVGGHFIGAFLHIIGFGAGAELVGGQNVLPVTWFQVMIYCNVMLFPITDLFVRMVSMPLLILLLSLCLFVASIIFAALTIILGMDMYINFQWFVWWPCFTSGVLSYHVWRRTHPNDDKPSTTWAVITDGVTILLLIFMILVAIGSCLSQEGNALVGDSCQDYSYEEFLAGEMEKGIYALGRWPSQLGTLFGWHRFCTPVIALWVYGLARGYGYTARLLSHDVLVRTLAPLAYPLYLLHMPTAMYIYWIFYAEEDTWWWPMVGSYIVPIPWYMFFLSVLLSLGVGALFQKFLVAPLTPYVLKSWEAFCCFGCSGAATGNTLSKVQTAIRRLTGSECDENTPLDRLGVDSFGTVALLGALRAAVPHARKLRPGQFYEFKTVGDLVRRLDELDETGQNSLC